MAHLALARKYRPKNFGEMVGQSHVVQALGNALTTQRLHHAYLFTGTRGVGKTTISRILAKSLNCLGADGQGGITATPCGVCQACTDIDSGRFVDYTELDAASNRGVDEIAQLLEQAVYKPVVGRFKVFMIDEVHMLTNTAFNAMLKTLEEPPAYLKFVLATTDPQKVPATVLSRCLQFNLRPMAPETVMEHLALVLNHESVTFDKQALRLLARAARGSMRDALSLTDQAIAFGSGDLGEASVRLMLGSVDRSYVFTLLRALAAGDGKTVVETTEALRVNGLSAATTLEDMTTTLQRMAVLQAVPSLMGKALGGGGNNHPAETPEASQTDDADADPEALETARLAQSLPPDETQLLYSLCLHGRSELGLAPDDYAALTMVLLRLLAFKAPTSAAPLQASSAGSAAEPAKKPRAEPVAAPPPPTAPVSVPKVPVVTAEYGDAAIDSIATDSTPTDSTPTDSAPVVYQPDPAVAVPVAAPVLTAPPGAVQAPLQAPAPSPVQPAPKTLVQLPVLQSTGESGAQTFERTPLGDTWAQLVGELIRTEAVAALVRELALQSELVAQADGTWTLRVERPSLQQGDNSGKLHLALQSLLADQGPLRLSLEAGATQDTPARRNAAAVVERQRAAEDIIHNDPFVQDMVRHWGAKVVPGSIKPRVLNHPTAVAKPI